MYAKYAQHMYVGVGTVGHGQIAYANKNAN